MPASGGGEAAGGSLGAASREIRTLGTEEIRAEMQRARGHTLFVHLWASWCAPCLEELPAIDRFARKARARGAVVLSVSLDTGYQSVARLPTLLQARAPNLTPIVAHFEDADRFIGLFSKSWEGNIPALFAFDRAGRLQRSVVGGLTPEELDALTTELVPPPKPR